MKYSAAVAYHEAGHAVAALYLFRPIRKVTIIPERNARGYCLHRRKRTAIDSRGMFDQSSYKVFANIICLYAGQLAQKRFAPRSLRLHQVSTGYAGGNADNDQMVGLALQQTDNDGVPLLLTWLKHEAEFLVKSRWREICAVADALLERKSLNGGEVRAVVNSLYRGPLVLKKARA